MQSTLPQTLRDPKNIHIPIFKPFFWLAFAVLVGILFAKWTEISWIVWVVCALICLIILLIPVFFKRRNQGERYLPFSAVLLFFFLGAMRYQLEQPIIAPEHSAFYNERGLVEVIGVVIKPPEVHDSSINLEIRVESLMSLSSDTPIVQSDQIRGKLMLQTMAGSDYRYGDRLQIEGKLSTPSDSGTFNYREYLANKGIYSQVSFAKVKVLERDTLNPFLAKIYQLKIRSQEVLQEIFPSPEAELLTGILLGNDNGLSKELQSAYQLTGTTHIIAISGFNIVLLAGLITRFSYRWFGPWSGSWIAIMILAFYTVLVGAHASVVRAVLMGSLGILGSVIGRKGNGLNTLGLAAMGMCLINPFLPWDIGFQLSFMATLGLVLYAGPMQARLDDFLSRHLQEGTVKRLSGHLTEYFLFTFAVQALTLPLIVWHFREISWTFLVANPFILPAQPLVMVLGGIALLGGLLAPELGRILGWLAYPFAAYTNRVVEWLARLYPASLNLQRISFFWIVLYYCVFLFLTLPKGDTKGIKKLASPNVFLLALSCGAFVIWSAVFSAPDSKLHMTILPESDSPTILIENTEGRLILLNGSIRSSSLREEIGKTLPFTRQELDVLIIPLCNQDNISGLVDFQDHIKIRQVAWACDSDRIHATQLLYQAFMEDKIVQTTLNQGDRIELGNGAFMTLLQVNSEVAAFSLQWEEINSIMIFGDSGELEGDLYADSPILVMPGDISSKDYMSILKVDPRLTILTFDPESLPVNDSMPDVDLSGRMMIFRSDLTGRIQIMTDGQQIWLDTEKK